MTDTKDTQKLFTQLQVLKNDVEQIANVNTKLDNAIDKLTDISGGIKSMLAVHEEKISQQEAADKALYELVESRRAETENTIKEVHSRISTTSKELKELIYLSEQKL